ncbi:MAG: phosphatidate cytidylyltransferase [Oscillospiraceae bacterium]|nr:phosphatidate cytidylyltransferase [Oscillospiraceae bacterium]
MKQRIITAAIGFVVLLLVLTQFYSPLFNVAGLIVYAIAVHEIRTAFAEKNSIAVFIVLDIVGRYFFLDKYIPRANTFVILVFAFAAYAFISVFEFEKVDIKVVSTSILFGLYVLFGFYCLVNYNTVLPKEQYGYDGFFILAICFFIAWGSDAFAYFSGYLFGKHKMAPVLSPKKTIEGAVGAFIGTAICTVLFVLLYCSFKNGMQAEDYINRVSPKLIFWIVMVSMAGTFIEIIGDLFASAVKRQTGIKDYGNLLPGHGGILDRFDSVILLAPFFFIIAIYISKIGGIFFV